MLKLLNCPNGYAGFCNVSIGKLCVCTSHCAHHKFLVLAVYVCKCLCVCLFACVCVCVKACWQPVTYLLGPAFYNVTPIQFFSVYFLLCSFQGRLKTPKRYDTILRERCYYILLFIFLLLFAFSKMILCLYAWFLKLNSAWHVLDYQKYQNVQTVRMILPKSIQLTHCQLWTLIKNGVSSHQCLSLSVFVWNLAPAS